MKKRLFIYLFLMLTFIILFKNVYADEVIPDKVILDKESVNAYVGMPISLASDVYPNVGENSELEWTSSDESIAIVSQNGVIQPIKKGTAIITAKSKKYNDIYANCTVNVFNDNKQPKVNVYLKSPYLFNSYQEKIAEGCILIKDYYYDSDYTVEWEPIDNNSEIEFKEQEKQIEYNGKIINIEDYEPDVFTITYKIKCKQENDVSGYIKVYEDGRLIENQKINITFDSRIYSDSCIATINWQYLFNTENLIVGDRIMFSGSNLTNIEILEGNCTAQNSYITFTEPGIVKARIVYEDSYLKTEKIYQFEIKENNLETEYVPITDENGMISVCVGDGNCMGLLKNVNYHNSSICKVKIIGEDLTIRGLPQMGGGPSYNISYNQRDYIGFIETQSNDPLSSPYERLIFLKPGIQKISILDSKGNETKQLTYNVKEPYIKCEIPQQLTQSFNLSSQILRGETNTIPVTFYGAPFGVIGSVEVEDSSIIEIENQKHENRLLTATLVPKKDGKTKVIIKYTMNYFNCDYYSADEIDPSVGEKYYSKNWYEKKYGNYLYLKEYEITVKLPEYLKGDLDRNNVVDANDASVALELYKAQNATENDILIGDMDNNQLIDANDASLILEYYKTHQ